MSTTTNGPVGGATYRGREVLFHQAQRADDPELLAFLRRLFRRPEYDERWLEHVRYGSPVAPRDYYIARQTDTGDLAGIYGLAPVRLALQGELGVASECCNIGVQPAFWGTGLFQDLSRFALEADTAKGRWLSFCSPRRPLAVKAHAAVGWTQLAMVRSFRKRMPAAGAGSVPEIEAVATFPAAVDPLLEASAIGFGWAVRKDHRYLSWRYAPAHFRRFTHRGRDGAIDGVVVLKDYVDPKTALRRTHIMEVVATDPVTREALMRHAERSAAGSDEQHTCAATESARERELVRYGFEHDGEFPLLAYAYSRDLAEAAAAATDRLVTLGDDEAY